MKSGSLTPIANIGVLLFFPAICIAGKTYTQQPEVQQVASPESDSAQATQLPRGKETPKWIWSAPVKEHVFLRKRFRCEQPRKATLLASCDNKMTIWLNGHQVAESSEWQRPVRVDVSRFMKPGENEILVDGRNAGGVAAFVALQELIAPG